MPTYVNSDKCDGCGVPGRPARRYIHPIDPMKLDPAIGKDLSREPDLGWEGYSCVKIRPNSAIEMRGHGDAMPRGAALKPGRGRHAIGSRVDNTWLTLG
jgi:adenylylsulfate reductase, subunit B